VSGGILLLVLGLTSTSWTWWPTNETNHTLTAHTSVPDHPDRQYSFEFRPERIDSFAWSSVFDKTPGGQVGDLEGVTRAQAVVYANALSKHDGHETCYRLAECGDDPTSETFTCEKIDPKPITCRGYRLPTVRELEILERTDRRTRFVQWAHEGELVDNRRVRGAKEDLRRLAGFALVRTVEYQTED
jgi:hypothetical protein